MAGLTVENVSNENPIEKVISNQNGFTIYTPRRAY